MNQLVSWRWPSHKGIPKNESVLKILQLNGFWFHCIVLTSVNLTSFLSYLFPLFSSFLLIRFWAVVRLIRTASVTWRSIGSFLKVSEMSILNCLISPLCLSLQCLHMSESSFLDIISLICSFPQSHTQRFDDSITYLWSRARHITTFYEKFSTLPVQRNEL